MESKEALLAYCRANGRVCPMPQKWSTLYDLLPERRRVVAGWSPPLPLILMAWDEPEISKANRLQLHIDWASEHGALDVVSDFLHGLHEEDWFHIGD